MQKHSVALTRRQLLAAGTGLLGSSLVKAQVSSRKKTVAAIVTMYTDDRSLKSHASVIVGRMLEGYAPNNVRTEPRTQVVSMYTDQVPANDLSRGLAEKHQFKIYPTVGEALCLGGDKLAVDAVLIVGEHGNYPRNEKGQKLYPRYELMEQVVDVFRRDQRAVPVFSDKHLSYSWWKAKRMFDWSRELKFPSWQVPPFQSPCEFLNWKFPTMRSLRMRSPSVMATWMPMAFIRWRRCNAWLSGVLEAKRCCLRSHAGG